MRRGREPGFTLIELLVTLAVLAVLATLAAPSFATFIEKSRLKGAADDVVNLLSAARIAAVKQQRNVNVSLGGTNTAWCIGANRAADPVVGQPMPGATPCDCTTPTACVLEAQLISGSNVTTQNSVVAPPDSSGVTSDSVSGSITFSGQLGTLTPITTTPGVVTLTSSTGKYALQITVSPLGQVGACVPSGHEFISGYPSC